MKRNVRIQVLHNSVEVETAGLATKGDRNLPLAQSKLARGLPL